MNLKFHVYNDEVLCDIDNKKKNKRSFITLLDILLFLILLLIIFLI